MLITSPRIIYWMNNGYRTKTEAMSVNTGSQAED